MEPMERIDAQAEAAARLTEIMAAAEAREVDRLEAYHLYGPRYTKFDDWEPLERQDAATARKLEREAISGADGLETQIEDLKVDVFGATAVATFVFAYSFSADDTRIAVRARSTLVTGTRRRARLAHRSRALLALLRPQQG